MATLSPYPLKQKKQKKQNKKKYSLILFKHYKTLKKHGSKLFMNHFLKNQLLKKVEKKITRIQFNNYKINKFPKIHLELKKFEKFLLKRNYITNHKKTLNKPTFGTTFRQKYPLLSKDYKKLLSLSEIIRKQLIIIKSGNAYCRNSLEV